MPAPVYVDRDMWEKIVLNLLSNAFKYTLLAALEQRSPDLLVSDIGMPEMDGYSLMRAIRSRAATAKLPSIAITAFARPKDRARALASGYGAHVAKPIEPIEPSDLVLAAAALLCPGGAAGMAART